jgi:lauroyl/myristoyl acyltransferase
MTVIPKTTYYGFRLAGNLVPRLPIRLAYAMFAALGGLAYGLNRAGRENVHSNLRHILGTNTAEAEIDRLARAAFTFVAYNYCDLFRLPKLSPEEVNASVDVRGWEHVEQALALGKGAVMTSAHFGNIEIVLYAMLLRGVAITIPAERIEPPELFAYITNLRTSQGLKLIPIDGPMIDLVRTLRRGGVAGIAGDRNITAQGRVVQFFDAPARLPDGHVQLAVRTQAPLITGFSRRIAPGKYEATFNPHFVVPDTMDEEECIAAGMHYVVSNMEKAIRACPEQWTVTADMWNQ